MRIGVLLRQVPDPEARLEAALAVDAAVPEVVDQSVPEVIDESDEAALDAALTLAGDGDEVVAIALGGERVEAAARKALALGAARAVRLPGLPSKGLGEKAADRGALGQVVAAAVRRESLDLLLAGAQTSAVGSGLLASACAVALGWPRVWLVLDASFDASRETLEVAQELEAGRLRRWRVRPPAVLAIQTGRFRARMPKIRGVLAAKRATIDVIDGEDLELAPNLASRLERVALERPAPVGGVEWIAGEGEGDGRSAGETLVRRLREEGVL